LTQTRTLFYVCSMNTVSIRSPACARLAALTQDAPEAAARFRRWRGRSGRAYLVSVYPIDACPDYIDAVLLAVDSASRTCVWVGEAATGLAPLLGALARAGADELHVHLLAGDAAARAAAIRDLDARH